jgi:hypothetical protein
VLKKGRCSSMHRRVELVYDIGMNSIVERCLFPIGFNDYEM